MAEKMKSEYQNSDKEIIEKQSIHDILNGLSNVFETDEEYVCYKSGIKVAMEQSAEEMRTKRDADPKAKFVEQILEDEALHSLWQGAKETFIKMHYFWMFTRHIIR